MTNLLYQQDQRCVAHVTLDRPDVHNAFNETLIEEMTDAFADIASSSHIRVVVLQGNGASFCAGADLDWMKRASSRDVAHNERDAMALSNMFHAIDTCPKPVIAAVGGHAFGGGVGLIACADMAVAVQRSRFALTEVRLGLTPATISPFVIRAIGPRQARRYMLTGETFDADQALRLGLVHQIAADEHDLAAITDSLIATLLQNAPGALADTKQLVADIVGQPITQTLRADTARRIANRRTCPEGREGIDAFLHKRAPDWILPQ